MLLGPVEIAAAPEDKVRHAVLALSVNGEDKDEVNALVRGKDFLLRIDELRKAGFVSVPGRAETIDGVSYVSLGALAPKVTYVFDEAEVALRLTVDPSLLSGSTVNLGRNRPKDMVYMSVPSAFLNYAVTAQDFNRFSAFSEQGASLGQLGPFDSAFFDNIVSRNNMGQISRTNTTLNLDDRDEMTRLQLGDTLANGGNLGGLSPLGGIGFSKEYSIDPYFTPFPAQRYSGIVNTPSTADVYVNGVLVRSVALPPGPFTLENIPALTGSGNTRIVIRNALGQQQELGAPYYLSDQSLAPGLHEFTYNLGLERNMATTDAFGDYRHAGFLAHHRFGLDDTFTPGAFLEADERLQAGGPELAVTTSFGQFGFFGAASRDRGLDGWAGSTTYSYTSRLFTIGGDFTGNSRRYATMSLSPQTDRALRQLDGYLAFPLDFCDLTGQLSRSAFRDAGRTDQASIAATRQLNSWANLSLTLSHAIQSGQPTDNRVLLSLAVAIDSDTSATFSASRGHDGVTGVAQIQKSPPLGEGYGYLVQTQTGSDRGELANLVYQGPFGLYEADVDRQLGQNSATVSASGAIGIIDGHVFATRPLNDGYALIRVPGVEGVTGYLENQPFGRTDSDGNLLVPNLLSYSGNRIGINDQDISMDYAVQSNERTVATSYRGGAVVEFSVHRLEVFIGTLKIRSGTETIVPAYGEIDISAEGGNYVSPIGDKGQFYFEELPAGSLPAVIRYRGRECRFTLKAPASAERSVNLGELVCTTEVTEG